MVGNRIKCEQAQHVIGDIKHYVMNNQENGRDEVDVIIGKRAMQETDLLAFHIGIGIGDPAAVMCSYNAINGDYACQNKYTLTDVLKQDWQFKGFVLSDWGGTHSTVKASAAGLDHEEPMDDFYRREAEAGGRGGQGSHGASGRSCAPYFAFHVSGRALRLPDAEERGRCRGWLGHRAPPRRAKYRSAQEHEWSAAARSQHGALHRCDWAARRYRHDLWRRIGAGGSARRAGRSLAGACVVPHFAFEGGVRRSSGRQGCSSIQERIPASAAALAGKSDVAIVFAYEWMSEGTDLPNLSLPENQDALIAQVAAANPRTIVVLETGTAVLMPWLDKVGGVLEAWYAGSKGADAVANVLFGKVNPSAKLPMTFPRSEADLPHPELVKPPDKGEDAGQQLEAGRCQADL